LKSVSEAALLLSSLLLSLTGTCLLLLQEDEILRKRIKAYGLNNWSVVADGLPGRSGKSCSERCASTAAAAQAGDAPSTATVSAHSTSGALERIFLG
jgi:hypothetical protein